MGPIIAIDFGTENCRAALFQDNHFSIIPHTTGNLSFPACFFHENGKELVGESARVQSQIKPLNTIYGVKRWLGLKPEKIPAPTYLKAGNIEKNIFSISLDGKQYTYQNLLAKFLDAIKRNAQSKLKTEISRIVSTVPNCWNSRQRLEFIEICRECGLEIEQLLNDTTAAVAGFMYTRKRNSRVMAATLGAGFFNVGIADIRKGIAEMLAATGTSEICTENWENLIIEWMKQGFTNAFGKPPAAIPANEIRFREESLKLLSELNTRKVAYVNMPYLMAEDNTPENLQLSITQQELKKILEPVLVPIREYLDNFLDKFRCNWQDIDEIVFVGECSKSFILEQFLAKFGKPLNRGIDPVTVPLKGAAWCASAIENSRKRFPVYEVLSYALDVDLYTGDTFKLAANTTPIPLKKRLVLEPPSSPDESFNINVICNDTLNDSRALEQVSWDLGKMFPSAVGTEKLEIEMQICESGILENVRKVGSLGTPVKTPGPFPSSEHLKGPVIDKEAIYEDPSNIPEGFRFADRFIIHRLVGFGGFSYIYQVTYPEHTKEEVEEQALKILKPEFNNDKVIRARFRRSAEGMLHIQHPNIVKIHEYCEFGGLSFIRMDYVNGVNLEKLMETKRFKDLDINTKVGIINGICKAIVALRKYSILHADLKPANIMITRDFKSKLIDFELSKFLKMKPIEETKVTGTPRYFSPEHLAAKSSFGEHSDIYSLGLIMYRILTGEFPRRQDDPKLDYTFSILSLGKDIQPIHPSDINSEIKREVGDAIVKSIQIKRADRFKKMEDLMLELAMFEFM